MRDLFSIVARNSIFGAFGKLSIKIISFAFTVVIVRWLGDEDYGKYALIWSYVVVFSMFSDIGLDLYAIREIAKRQFNSQYIVGNIMALRLALALVSIFVLVVVIWTLGYSGQFLLQIFLASLILLLYAVQDPLDAALQANERFDISAAAIIIGLLVFISTGTLFLLMGWGITGIIVARLLNVVVSAILSWKLLAGYRRDLQWQINPALWADYIKVSIPFGLIKLWVNWSLRIDLIILAWFWTNQVVGWYGAAHAIILGIIVISSSVNAALYPRLSRQFTEDPRLMASIYEFAIKYLLVIALPIAGGISLVAGKAVELLYGAQYAPTALALAIIIWILPLVSISEFFRYVLLVTNREKVALQTLLFAALLHVVLNLWLVPTYGFLAAAVVSVASELVLILLYIHHLKREFKSINFGNVVLKPLAATLILIGVVTILSPNGLILQVGLGALAYFFAIWVLGVVNLDDFRQLLFSLLSYKQPLPELTMTETSKSNPLVSIFIPAYNAGQFLTQAIESVLSQTYSNYELIIIDDCSTDNTADILKQYQSHSSVRIYHNPVNTGMAPNWNIGLSKCRGELVAKLDADDFYEPDYLETMVEFFRNNETVGLLFSGLNLIYPDDRREPEMRFLRSWVRDRASFLPRLLQSCIIRSPTVCVRRACYERLGGFVEQMRLHADWEMWVRIAANYPVGYVARRLANYRTSYGQNTTAQSITNGWSMQDLRHWLDLLENDQLPYRLAEDEEFNFRWGIYNLEMHFAAISAYNRQNKLQQVYTAFAEESLPYRPSALTIEEMRWAYTNFHQGIHAFRENNPKEAWHYFLQAIKPSRSLQSWPKLILIFKITKRLAGGLSYHLFVKYCPGL